MSEDKPYNPASFLLPLTTFVMAVLSIGSITYYSVLLLSIGLYDLVQLISLQDLIGAFAGLVAPLSLWLIPMVAINLWSNQPEKVSNEEAPLKVHPIIRVIVKNISEYLWLYLPLLLGISEAIKYKNVTAGALILTETPVWIVFPILTAVLYIAKKADSNHKKNHKSWLIVAVLAIVMAISATQGFVKGAGFYQNPDNRHAVEYQNLHKIYLQDGTDKTANVLVPLGDFVVISTDGNPSVIRRDNIMRIERSTTNIH